MDCVKEMYQVLAFNEYINYKILEERYNNELVANGYEPINESIGESITEGFKKIIDFIKKIIEKIIHFITVVIPGAIKKIADAITSISKRDDNKEKIDISGMSDEAKAKTKVLVNKANVISKKEAKVAAIVAAAAATVDIEKNKPTTSKTEEKSNTVAKNTEEQIQEARKEIYIMNKNFDKDFDAFMKDPDSKLVFGDKIEVVKTIKKAKDQNKILLLEDKESKKEWVGSKGYFYDRKIYERFMDWFDKNVKNLNSRINDSLLELTSMRQIIDNRDYTVNKGNGFSVVNYMERCNNNLNEFISKIDEEYAKVRDTMSMREYPKIIMFNTKDGIIDDLKNTSKYIKAIEKMIPEATELNKKENKDEKYASYLNKYINIIAQYTSLVSKNINKIAQVLIEVNKNVLYFNATKVDIYK